MSQYQIHGSRKAFTAANSINNTDIPFLRAQELNSLQQVPSPTQLWDSMHGPSKTPNLERGAQNDSLEMLQSRVTRLGTNVAPPDPAAPSASHRHPDGHPVPSIPSPRVSSGVPDVLPRGSYSRAPHQAGTFRTSLSPSPGKGDTNHPEDWFFPFPKSCHRSHPWCTHASRGDEPRPGWQEGSAGSCWALPCGDSPAGATRWPQSPGLRRAPCPAPPALPLQRVPAAVPAT